MNLQLNDIVYAKTGNQNVIFINHNWDMSQLNQLLIDQLEYEYTHPQEITYVR